MQSFEGPKEDWLCQLGHPRKIKNLLTYYLLCFPDVLHWFEIEIHQCLAGYCPKQGQYSGLEMATSLTYSSSFFTFLLKLLYALLDHFSTMYIFSPFLSHSFIALPTHLGLF